MKKKISVICAIALILASASFACATSKSIHKDCNLSISGNTATCTATVSQYGSVINVSASLYHGNTRLATWNDIDTDIASISGNYPVVSGQTYTLKVNASVDGQSVYIAPITKTCP